MARAESPLAALGRRMSVELARARQQQHQQQEPTDDRRLGPSDERRRGQGAQDDQRRVQSAQDSRARARVLTPPARAFVPASLSVPAWRVSQLSHVSSVSSMQSYATALESPESPSPPRTPSTPEARTPTRLEAKAPEESIVPPYESLAPPSESLAPPSESLAPPPPPPPPPPETPEESLALPVLRVRSGTDGSADTPSLTRSRTVSSSGSGSVRTAGREKEREEEQAGADEKAGVGAGAGAVEVCVNGVPVEYVPLPRDTQGTARRRTTLRKKHAPLVAAQVTVAVSPAHDERAVKRGGTIKRVWRKMFKSAGAR
ncbi:hypothetical protein POSPLADRAFT_1049424 [Postia placenta MAD-698-R-SB12]|uniref:Uncharacterized protein n=1 Tax=Postia placenta MAD-698-R-SB12 TaxID=670580 RepID=A0A1X6MPL8_9APHY|nr:hypothetical protein POSPLADRAFT_1049424 [Postia placenta MAD-698-R-SB12]OSX58156.1 hypothetical protein POSPLADRAFT_1049424 [Postia placenta MAD-698-R-SB12]